MLTLERAYELLNEYPTVFYTRTLGDLIMFDYRYKEYRVFQNHPEAREMRGIVFHRDGRLASRPFHVFYNVYEMETERDIVYEGWYGEKQDGSMVQVSWFDGEVIVASRSSLDGYVNVTATPLVTPELREYVRRNQEFTFLFELLDPGHTIVLKHYVLELVFLAARHKGTGEYHFMRNVPTRINEMKELTPEIWQTILSQQENDDGSTEGVVLYTRDGEIYKQKTPWYVMVHRLATSLHPKDYILAWARGDLDDIVSRLYGREDVSHCLDVTNDFIDRLTETVTTMAKVAKTKETVKDAALAFDRSDPMTALVFPDIMSAYRAGMLGEVGHIFLEVKDKLTETKVKRYLDATKNSHNNVT